MTKENLFKIHLFFLGMVASFFLTGRARLLGHLLFCWTLQEGASLWYDLGKGQKLRQWRFTPVGMFAITKGTELGTLAHYIGSMAGVALSICFFAMEEKDVAGLSLCLAMLRLLPLLPFGGGRLAFSWLGRWRGTLWAAGVLTKIGKGFAIGLMVCGVVWATLFPYDWWLFLGGAYLFYANAHEFLQMTKDFYEQMLTREGDKPVRGIAVTGEESLLSLVMRLHPKEETFFFRGETGGVSGERVLLGVLTGKGKSWVWGE